MDSKESFFSQGQVLNDTYRIIDKIGSGGGGIIYRARHLRLNTDVAVKKIRTEKLRQDVIRREADILKNLKHPQLPRVYDFVETDEAVYTVMDYIPGQSLDKAIKDHGRYEPKEVFRWAEQLLDALSYLHSFNPTIIHGDIKPANIMLLPDGNVCLIDFNISLAMGVVDRASVGISPSFSPPEQYGSAELYEKVYAKETGAIDRESISTVMPYFGTGIDTPSDVYSLGSTLYLLMTGVVPSRNFDRIIPLSAYDIDISEGFCITVEKMMAINPADRYRDGRECYKALKNCYKLDADYRRRKRNRALAIIALCGAAGMAASAAFVGFKLQKNRQETLYQKRIIDAGDAFVSGDTKAAGRLLNEAQNIMPGRVEAYVKELELLFENLQYEDCIKRSDELLRIGKIALREGSPEDVSFMGDFYYITANASFGLEKYEDADRLMDMALSYRDEGTYYRDKAIIKGRLGDLVEAFAVLNKAREVGIDEGGMYMATGELYVLKGDYDEGIEYLEKAGNLLGNTGDKIKIESLKYMAYINQGKSGGYTGESSYKKALISLENLETFGPLPYNLREAKGVIYYEIGDYEKAGDEFSALREAYPDDYRPCKKLALNELYIQDGKNIDDRDYDEFVKWADKAIEMSEGTIDAEMDFIIAHYNELKDNGWIR